MKQALIYSLKVWLTALLLSPAIAFPIWLLAEWIISYTDKGKGFSTGIAYGIDFSIDLNTLWYYLPYLVVLFVSANYLQGRSMRHKKVLFTVLTIVLTLSPFTFLKVIEYDAVFNMQLVRVISFGLLFIGGVWFYKLKPIDAVPSIPSQL